MCVLLKINHTINLTAMQHYLNMFVVTRQSSIAVLGECDKEPKLCLRHLQIQHCGCLPYCDWSNLHGQLLHPGAQAHQGFPFQ